MQARRLTVSRVGVIGLGGLGHMAVKLASGRGAEVTVMSRTSDKKADALALGADRLLISSDKDAMARAESSFDLIIDTVPVRHDVSPYMPLLDIDGTLVIVGHLGPIDELFTGTSSGGAKVGADFSQGKQKIEVIRFLAARLSSVPGPHP